MDDRDVVSGLQDSTARDRLSELPNSLIHTILSFLEMRDVVRTTFLSKRWNNLWTSVPCLHFRSHFCSNHYIDELDYDKDYEDLYTNFVNRALALWKGTKILKFSLNFVFIKSIVSDFDSWVVFAIEKQVEELNIICRNDYCKPHQRLYSCSSLRKLSLVGCELKIVESVKWNQLTSLLIDTIIQTLDEDVMNKVISGAPRLQDLSLCISECSNKLNIESNSLKMLKIAIVYMTCESKNSILRISAPNLETLKMFGFPFRRCLLNVPCLTNASLGFHHRDYYRKGRYFDDVLLEEMLRQVFLSILDVENLILSSWCIKVIVELKRKDKLVELSTAKILKFKVSAADEILDVLEMFPKMTMLIVQLENLKVNNLFNVEPYVDCYDACNSLVPKTFCSSPSLPHLRTIEVTCDSSNANSMIPVVEILLENTHVLEKMVLRSRTLFAEKEKLLSMPRSSSTAELIIDPSYRISFFSY